MVQSGLVGRDRETDALDGWLAAALRGDPRLVLCRGEQGIGKTRLGEEIVARAVTRGVVTAWGRSAEADGAPPYWPWRQVLRGTPGVARVAGELGVAADVAPLAPEASPASSPDETGGEERFRLFDAVSRVLHAAAAPRGLLVVLDDVQWADRPSLLLLLHLARQLRGSRLMLLATHHDLPVVDGAGADPLGEVLPELVREPVTERVELTGLTRAAVAELLDLRSAENTPAGGSAPPVTADLVARVHELTGGNPFFVGELARYLAAGRPGIPPSVRDAIARRMDRLSPRCRHQLRAASIVGRQFSVAVVAAVIGQPVLECLDPLDEAVAAGFVEPSATAGDHHFVHALVRDAVEAGLPTSERVRLHRAAVEAIERFHADRLDPHLSDLARHWAAAAVAGERALAAGWIERAGDEAMRRLAFEEGARFYRLALDTGEPELDGLARHRLLVALADARHRSADRAGSAEACLAAAAVARGLDRPDLLGDAVLVLGCVNDTGTDRTLRALCEESLAGLGTSPPPRRARLLALLAETHMYLEDVGLADVASRDALAVADACGDPAALVDALRARQMARSGPDGDEERAALTERMFAVGSGIPSTRMWAHLWRIDTCVERGELFDAAAELDRLAWSAGQVGGPTGRWHVLKVKAALAQAHGRFADARLLADEAFAATPEGGHAGSVGARMVLLTALDHHTGTGHGGTTAMAALDAAGGAVAAGSGYRITYTLGPAVILTDAGRLDEAGALYRSLGPPRSWRPPPFFLLACYAAGHRGGDRPGREHRCRRPARAVGAPPAPARRIRGGRRELRRARGAAPRNGREPPGRPRHGGRRPPAGPRELPGQRSRRIRRRGAGRAGRRAGAARPVRRPRRGPRPRRRRHRCRERARDGAVHRPARHARGDARAGATSSVTADRTRAGGRGMPAHGHEQPADRRRPVRLRAHGAEPRPAHPVQARLLPAQPDRGVGGAQPRHRRRGAQMSSGPSTSADAPPHPVS